MILVVDDNPDMSLLLLRMLQAEGFEAATANDGESALQFVLHHRPLCIVLDLSMPGMSGLDVLHTIRGDTKYGNPKVLVFSAHGGQFKDDAIRAGADGYVVKGSLDWLKLIDWVQEWCPRSRASNPPPSDRNDRDVC